MTLVRRFLLAALLMTSLGSTLALAASPAMARDQAALARAMAGAHSCTAMIDGDRSTVVCSFPKAKPESYVVPSAWVRTRMTATPGVSGLYQSDR